MKQRQRSSQTRTKGYAADYRGAKPEDVGRAVLTYRPKEPAKPKR